MYKFLFFLALLINTFILYPQTETINILSVNDSHSYLVPASPRASDNSGTIGGIARIASYFGHARLQDPNTILLHSGDFSIGDPFYNIFFGVPELQILKSLQLDAMTAGNHEFDVGVQNLYGILTQGDSAGFPLLSSNAVLDSFPALKDFVLPYTVKQYGSIKVGIFGLTTPETNILSSISPCSVSEDIMNISAAMVDTLTRLECKVIILLSHMGIYYDKIIAENVPGINVICGGHDHLKIDTVITTNNGTNDVYICQGGSFYENICSITLNVSSSGVTLQDHKIIPVDVNIPEEPTVKATIDELASQIETSTGIPMFTTPVCEATKTFYEVAPDLLKGGIKSTAVGNLITDAFRLKTGSDIAITAGGSTARQIDSGKVLGVDLFRAIGYGLNDQNPFGFRLVKIKMYGEVLSGCLAIGLATPANDEFLIQTSGLKYTYLLPSDSLRIDSVLVNGQLIDPVKEYTITINEMLYMFLTANQIPFEVVETYSTTEFEALTEYCQTHGTITPDTEGRIIAYDTLAVGIKDESGILPQEFLLEQNYPNPFNPSTTIQYTVPKASIVNIELYNVIGERVAVLINEIKDAGSYSLQFHTTGNFASGVYFYRLRAATLADKKETTIVKKMILLK